MVIRTYPTGPGLDLWASSVGPDTSLARREANRLITRPQSLDSNKHSLFRVYLDGWIYWERRARLSPVQQDLTHSLEDKPRFIFEAKA